MLALLQVEMSCGAGLLFSPGTQQCGWPAEVVAVRPECRAEPPSPAVHCDEISPLRGHPADCHAYFQCSRPANDQLREVRRQALRDGGMLVGDVDTFLWCRQRI